MKLRTITLISALMAFLSAGAQTVKPEQNLLEGDNIATTQVALDEGFQKKEWPKYELNFGWALWPVTDFGGWGFFAFGDAISNMINSNNGQDSSNENVLKGARMTGVVSAQFNIRFNKLISLDLQGNFDSMYYPGASEKNIYFASFIPYVRFVYLNRPNVNLYSSIGLGVWMMAGRGNVFPFLAAQAVPFGVNFGRKVYGLAELELGTVACGARVGIGFRFN